MKKIFFLLTFFFLSLLFLFIRPQTSFATDAAGDVWTYTATGTVSLNSKTVAGAKPVGVAPYLSGSAYVLFDNGEVWTYTSGSTSPFNSKTVAGAKPVAISTTLISGSAYVLFDNGEVWTYTSISTSLLNSKTVAGAKPVGVAVYGSGIAAVLFSNGEVWKYPTLPASTSLLNSKTVAGAQPVAISTSLISGSEYVLFSGFLATLNVKVFDDQNGDGRLDPGEDFGNFSSSIAEIQLSGVGSITSAFNGRGEANISVDPSTTYSLTISFLGSGWQVTKWSEAGSCPGGCNYSPNVTSGFSVPTTVYLGIAYPPNLQIVDNNNVQGQIISWSGSKSGSQPLVGATFQETEAVTATVRIENVAPASAGSGKIYWYHEGSGWTLVTFNGGSPPPNPIDLVAVPFMGANGNQPQVIVLNADGNLYAANPNGGWGSIGSGGPVTTAPLPFDYRSDPPIAVASTAGFTGLGSGCGFSCGNAFVLTDSGNIYWYLEGGSNWAQVTFTNGSPSYAIDLVATTGVSNDYQEPQIIALDEDGELYAAAPRGGFPVVSSRVDSGVPPSKPVAVTSAQAFMNAPCFSPNCGNAFVLTTFGNIYMYSQGSGWTQVNFTTPPPNPIDLVAVPSSTPDQPQVIVLNADGNLYAANPKGGIPVSNPVSSGVLPFANPTAVTSTAAFGIGTGNAFVLNGARGLAEGFYTSIYNNKDSNQVGFGSSPASCNVTGASSPNHFTPSLAPGDPGETFDLTFKATKGNNIPVTVKVDDGDKGQKNFPSYCDVFEGVNYSQEDGDNFATLIYTGTQATGQAWFQVLDGSIAAGGMIANRGWVAPNYTATYSIAGGSLGTGAVSQKGWQLNNYDLNAPKLASYEDLWNKFGRDWATTFNCGATANGCQLPSGSQPATDPGKVYLYNGTNLPFTISTANSNTTYTGPPAVVFINNPSPSGVGLRFEKDFISATSGGVIFVVNGNVEVANNVSPAVAQIDALIFTQGTFSSGKMVSYTNLNGQIYYRGGTGWKDYLLGGMTTPTMTAFEPGQWVHNVNLPDQMFGLGVSGKVYRVQNPISSWKIWDNGDPPTPLVNIILDNPATNPQAVDLEMKTNTSDYQGVVLDNKGHAYAFQNGVGWKSFAWGSPPPSEDFVDFEPAQSDFLRLNGLTKNGHLYQLNWAWWCAGGVQCDNPWINNTSWPASPALVGPTGSWPVITTSAFPESEAVALQYADRGDGLKNYVLSKGGNIYKWTGSAWEKVNTPSLFFPDSSLPVDFKYHTDGLFYVLSQTGYVYKLNVLGSAWETVHDKTALPITTFTELEYSPKINNGNPAWALLVTTPPTISAVQLVVNGGVIAIGGFTLGRDLSTGNANPAEKFVADPKYYVNFKDLFFEKRTIWKEVP